MPKIDWSQNEEKNRCFHKPLCPMWQTTQGRQLRVCRMSATHLDSAILSIRWASSNPGSNALDDSYWVVTPEMEDEFDYWSSLREVLITERKRRK